MKEGSSQSQLNRKYLPQHLEDYISASRASLNIFPPSIRTRKRLQKIGGVPISILRRLKPAATNYPLPITHHPLLESLRKQGNRLSNLPFGRTPDYRRTLKAVATIILLFAICYLLFVPRCEAASAVGSGEASLLGLRKIISNEWGYWVFYDDGVNFVWKYSQDGVNWPSDEEYTSHYNKVFDDVSESHATPPLSFGSVWYVEDSSTVYVAAGPKNVSWSPSVQGKAWVRKGTLQQDGSISWLAQGSQEANINFDADEWIKPNSKAVIFRASDEYMWLAAEQKDMDTAGRGAIVTGKNTGATNLVTSSGWTSRLDTVQNTDPDDNQKINAVPIDAGRALALQNDDGLFRGIYVAAANNSSTAQTVGTNAGTDENNYSQNICAVTTPDFVYTHIVWVGNIAGAQGTQGYVCYSRRTNSTNNYSTGITLDQTNVPAKNATITLMPNNEIYVAYDSYLGSIIYRKYNSSSSVWESTQTIVADGVSPCFPYKPLPAPNPLPFIYTGTTGVEEGKVLFDRIITSTLTAPGISNIQITNDYLTSQYFQITVSSGSPGPFQTWGTKASLGFSLATSSYTTVSDFSIVSSTVTQSQIVATLKINPTIDGGPYKVIVFNPDGQSSQPSGQTFTIPAPTISSFSPQSGGQGANRSISFSGSNYQNWGTTSTVVEADFGSEVKFTSTTYTSSLGFTAHIKVDDDASGGLYTVKVTNPDGQYVELGSTFTVTVPSVAISTPAANGDIDIQTKLLDISGTAWITPSTPATCLGAELRIKRQSDGLCWNGVAFQDEAEVGHELWNDANGTNWTYDSTKWDDQQDGQTYIIQARGRSSDGGHGYQKV
ncbi:hypothetical protein MUO65_01140, partial [bacterium]|nr:hypothetical protein [bacterium]